MTKTLTEENLKLMRPNQWKKDPMVKEEALVVVEEIEAVSEIEALETEKGHQEDSKKEINLFFYFYIVLIKLKEYEEILTKRGGI